MVIYKECTNETVEYEMVNKEEFIKRNIREGEIKKEKLLNINSEKVGYRFRRNTTEVFEYLIDNKGYLER